MYTRFKNYRGFTKRRLYSKNRRVRTYGGIGKLGTDAIFDQNIFERGRKLVNKIWNVSKFIEMHLQDYEDKEFSNFEYMDRWILGSFQEMEKGFIKYLDEYEVGLALNHLEKFFWDFCDNYIEIVKHRLYRPEEFGNVPRYSGQKTIYILLYKLLQDFSIYFPFITEEIYQELYHDNKSIHLTRFEPLEYDFSEEIKYGNLICDIISQVRGEKSSKNLSLKAMVGLLDISVDGDLKEAINEAVKDFKATLFIEELRLGEIDDGYKINKVALT